MSKSVYKLNSRSSRILDLVKDYENNNRETQTTLEDQNLKCESSLPKSNLDDAEFAALENMIDEELSQDRSFPPNGTSNLDIQTPPGYDKLNSEASVILDSNDNTPLPSPLADFNLNSDVEVNEYIQNENLSSENPYETNNCEVIQTTDSPVPTPSVNSLISASECDSPSSVGSKKRKATYKTNPGKKRIRREDQWIDTKRKTLLNSGQQYKSRDGKVRNSKKLGPTCPNTCKLKCNEKFSVLVREKIHSGFWKLGDHTKQWEYINKFTDRQNKRRMTTEGPSRRKFTTKYFLPLASDENPSLYDRVQVCLKTFKNTLSITDQVIRTAHNKLSQEGTTIADNRGKHSMHPIKIDEVMKKSVCDHIASFQPVESHYTRKSSTKRYLDNNLTMTKLFQLYKEWDELKNYDRTVETLRQYQDIVNENMNVAFFVPKKDLCDKCHAYSCEKNPTDKQTEEYSKHIENKTLAREFKESDKRRAQNLGPKVVCATFDFQKILNSLHGDVGLFYYKRKLSVYNFTVFDLAQKEASCYMWTECTARRGANEVSSCLMHFIKTKIDEGVKSFLFWSDNCAGQNRNRVVYSMYMLMSQKYNVDITHRFLEQGHTQNEGDSVHALIERESKGKLIYTPDQWYALVRWAKTSGKPYKVIEVSQEQIFDFKVLLVDRHWKKNTANENVRWNNLREIQVKKEDPNYLYLKYDFNGETHCLKTLQETRRGRKINKNVEIKNLYNETLPLPEAKYKDLISLCNSGAIPKEYYRFFQSLKHKDNVADDSDTSE